MRYHSESGDRDIDFFGSHYSVYHHNLKNMYQPVSPHGTDPQDGPSLSCLVGKAEDGEYSGRSCRHYLLIGFELFQYFGTRPYWLNMSLAISDYFREQSS